MEVRIESEEPMGRNSSQRKLRRPNGPRSHHSQPWRTRRDDR